MAEPRRFSRLKFREKEDEATGMTRGAGIQRGEAVGGEPALVPQGTETRFDHSPSGARALGQATFETTPDEDPLLTADKVLRQIVNGDGVNPFATNKIMASLDRYKAMTPEVSFVLSHPDLVEEWQSAMWTGAMDALMENFAGDQTDAFRGRVESHATTEQFFSRHGNQLSAEERELFITMIAAMPDAAEIAAEKGVRSYGGGLWGHFKTGWETITRAPETIRGNVNDPRWQAVTQADLWLSENELRTPEQKYDFFNWLGSKTMEANRDVASMSQGFYRIAQQTVGFIPDVIINEGTDALVNAADPSGFGSRQYLSLGQNVAFARGINPADSNYETVSAVTDGFANVFLDPQNIMFGLGSGMKAARNIPRTVSRAQAFRYTLNPIGSGRALRLPLMDRGLVSRFTYATLSRTAEEMLETKGGANLIRWLAGASSATEIMDRIPSLKSAEHVATMLARETDEAWVKEILRFGLSGAGATDPDSPLIYERSRALLASAADQYSARRAEIMADPNASLHSLDVNADRINVLDVYQPPVVMNENVTETISRNLPRLSRSPVHATAILPDDARVTIRRAGDSYAAFDEEGVFMGGVMGATRSEPQIAVLPEFRNRGVGRALVDNAEDYGINRSSTAPVTGAAADLLGMERTPVFTRTTLSGDGTRKAVLSAVGRPSVRRLDLADRKTMRILTSWLSQKQTARAEGLIAEIAGGMPISRMSEDGKKLLIEYATAAGADTISQADEVLLTRKGQDLLLEGADSMENVVPMSRLAQEDYFNYTQAFAENVALKSRTNRHLWVIKDVQEASLTARTRRLLGGTRDWGQGLRRLGFQFTHKLPTNISVVSGAQGTQELRNWIKALGGSDELANKWGDLFLAGTPANRKNVILDAMREVGEEIENPMLREGLIQFGEKQGHYTYMYDRNGREIGLAPDGSIMPMTISHFSDTFAMPDARTLIRSIRRYKSAKARPRVSRGLITSTRSNRQRLANNLKVQAKRKYGVEVSQYSDDDWLAMGYADILGAEWGRGTGMGYVAKAASLSATPFKMLHSVFTIAQLAGRPIAWASRVLLEESVRADLMGMPSVWANPAEYIARVWDSHQIRKMPADLRKQAKVVDGLITDLFSGGVDLRRLDEVIPGFSRKLSDEGILPNDTARVKSFASSIIGREMLGGNAATQRQLGLRGNITRRALLRDRRIRGHKARLDRYGLTDTFRWKIDGSEIANRTYWQNFIKEADAATIPMEWATLGMTPQGIAAYGRGYGRQIMQQLNDPILGGIGVNRAIARALGQDVSNDAHKLANSPLFGRVEHLVDRRLAAEGIPVDSSVAKAQWYLENVVDEVLDTLIDPLARQDPQEKARLLQSWKNGGTATLEVGGVRYTMSADPDNYEGFVNNFSRLAQSAYDEGLELPAKISAYLDPRFGQRKSDGNFFRRAADSTMQVFGENASQYLNRQPAFLDVHRKYFEQYTRMGWSAEDARVAATEKAAELVNYVFFSNRDIPQFLHDMNKVVPFFSAFWEVAGTWAYKIPSVNVLPVGYAQLGRRVQRVYRGLIVSGLVTYDPEANRMTLNISEEMANAKPGAAGLGRALYEMTRLPITMAEWTVGMGKAVADTRITTNDGFGIELGEFDAGDFSAFAKDGFELAIGNPIDPTSHGIMAVNQFAVGLTPALNLPMSYAARAVFDGANEKMDTGGMTVAEFLLENEDMQMAELLRWNSELFIRANNEELFNRALAGDFPLGELAMPEYIELPGTSAWETLIDRTFFPFGKMNHPLEVVSSVSPAAMNHVWRGLFHQAGMEPDSDFMGYLFGQLSNYQVASELITQAQMLEASEGLLTRSLELSTELQRLIDAKSLAIAEDPDGSVRLLDPEQEGTAEFHRIKDELDRINGRIWKSVNENAGWSLIMRGLMGQLLPATPRMWTNQQQMAQEYWSVNNMAREAQATGSANFADLQPRQGDFDIIRLAETTNAWLNDPSGDEAKRWAVQNNPGLLAFTQGKTFWGPAGPPPESEGFDKWIEELENKERKAFEPEVWMRRYQGAALGVDRQIAIIDEYGNDPDQAATAIFRDYDRYRTVTEQFDAAYDALDFMDTHLYEGRYKAWLNREGLDSLSEYELVRDRMRRTQEELDNITDILEYGDLSPDERRRIRGILNSTVGEMNDAIREARVLAEDDTYSNPLEQIIAEYFREIAAPYWEGRNDIFALLDDVDSKDERSAIFDLVRAYDNEHFSDAHSILSPYSGQRLRVPSEIVRSWNGRAEQERQERLVEMVGKKPEWLNLFEVSLLTQVEPAAAQYLPSTPEEMRIYDDIANQKRIVIELARANPDEITQSRRDKVLGELNDELLRTLIQNGRGAEALFREAVPIQKAAMVGLLPESLDPVLPMVNQILAELRANEESPTTEAGRRAFLALRDYLESTFFKQEPQAEIDFDELGLVMFDEPLRDAAYAKLMQGDFFGQLD